MPGFGINTSCIKSIKASYKAKLDSNKRVRGMSEYQAAEREIGGEAGVEPRREVSRTGAAAAEPEPRIVAPKEQTARKSWQAVAKRSRGSASKGEPSPKKARRESEAEASMHKVVPPGVEEQGRKKKKRRKSPSFDPAIGTAGVP